MIKKSLTDGPMDGPTDGQSGLKSRMHVTRKIERKKNVKRAIFHLRLKLGTLIPIVAVFLFLFM